MLYTLIGLAGVVMYVLGYWAVQVWQWNASGFRYLMCNTLGALFTLISLVHNFNLAAFITQVIWLLISFYGMGRIWLSQKATPRAD
ncbi:MAG: CBU_0592 family membrane protein [Formosimonas sp.]